MIDGKNFFDQQIKSDIKTYDNIQRIATSIDIEYRSIGAHWIPLYIINNNNLTYFDSFGDENIPKESKKVIGNKNIITNFYRIQPYKSIMCKYIGFIDFMIKKKMFASYTNLLSTNDYEKNDKIIIKYF